RGTRLSRRAALRASVHRASPQAFSAHRRGGRRANSARSISRSLSKVTGEVQVQETRLGKFVELLPAADGLHMGINISRMCSHLWPRASRDAAHRNSPSSASRAIARAFCPTVIAPCANANLSEADGDVDARCSSDCATQLKRKWRVTASSFRT